MRQVRQAGLESLHDSTVCPEGAGVQLSEWEREGWTYHAKGSVSTLLLTAPFLLTHALKASGCAQLPTRILASLCLVQQT
jgi:hypothetical protein